MGRVIRFDEVRGYGFITPDGGGEDVFLHANDIVGDKWTVRAGARVEFEVQVGERGLKASHVRLVEGAGRHGVGAPPVDDDGMCDTLTVREFQHEVTELCVTEVPSLTGAQVVQLRESLARFAQRHGWADG